MKFAGKIFHSDLPAFLSDVDYFISLIHKPSLSIGTVEAAASGKPIITFAQKNKLTCNGYLTHQKEVYPVNSVSPDEVAKAMKLPHKDSHLRNSVSVRARKVAEQYFSHRVARKQLEELIQKIS